MPRWQRVNSAAHSSEVSSSTVCLRQVPPQRFRHPDGGLTFGKAERSHGRRVIDEVPLHHEIARVLSVLDTIKARRASRTGIASEQC